MSSNELNSTEFARYLEQTGNVTKPWLLAQLRLMKLKEQRSQLSLEEYEQRVTDIHQDVMNLGEWWVGIEDEVF
ncbi:MULTISPECIES: hypothetical protein [Leptolyngbya]|uniref:Uncharacterized protein n=2 Tax=Leptolyngbya boryana TaxID=1184 RepID=A0A1Z4JF69_LEPBY|nr:MULTISPECIES: hypothetical protein [Leptolyngbya]BAY55127.1 hypothetical protein NIES2135_19490 [Leptolyngbya boryana NIES-2135]MBD1855371.1 hypothetical protein [Leptolyngbya sp. FACHB-1624]MBD2366107.1 hypothetical protein [Leptolyngbya sp. FACHB-161]MBD2372287.1 hypothetical protein [Leptolyngbya sp. FACHB-238]MBD2396710.1 hypothetical protein [Leptolyngbya sp. FACHB-239]